MEVNSLVVLTKKELIENGWIDKYVLGLTSETESMDVERLATLYPEIQDELNKARIRICGNFNRNLTQPALRHSMLTKRRVLYGSALLVGFLLIGLGFLFKAHLLLRNEYTWQAEQLARVEAMLVEINTQSRTTNSDIAFIQAATTRSIKMVGCDSTPDAEVMVYQCRKSGKMRLRIIDLPELSSGQRYEVWASNPHDQDRLLGQLTPPLRYDSLYVLDSALLFSTLQIKALDLASLKSEPICLASVSK